MCKCSLSLSLSLVHSEALSFVRCRRFANRDVSYLPINLRTGRRTAAAHLVLCASVSHFLLPPAAVLFTSAAILRLCSSSERPPHLGSVFQGFRGGTPRGTGKIDSSPPAAATLWCVTTRTTTHAVRATPPSATNAPTPTQSVNLPFFPLLRLRCSARLCWDVVSMVFFTLWSFSELRHHFLVFPCTNLRTHLHTDTLACGGILRTLSK